MDAVRLRSDGSRQAPVDDAATTDSDATRSAVDGAVSATDDEGRALLDAPMPAARALALLRRANRETPSGQRDEIDGEWTPRERYRVGVFRAALLRYVRAAVEESSATSRQGAIETRIDNDLTRIKQGINGGMLGDYDETRVSERDGVRWVTVDFAMGCSWHHDVIAFSRTAAGWRYFASTVGIEVPSPRGGMSLVDVQPLAPVGAERRLLVRSYATFCASQWHSQGVFVLQGDGAHEGGVVFEDSIPTCVGCGGERVDFGRTQTGFWLDLAVERPSLSDDSPAPRACLTRIAYEVGARVRRVTDPSRGRCARRVF